MCLWGPASPCANLCARACASPPLVVDGSHRGGGGFGDPQSAGGAQRRRHPTDSTSADTSELTAILTATGAIDSNGRRMMADAQR